LTVVSSIAAIAMFNVKYAGVTSKLAQIHFSIRANVMVQSVLFTMSASSFG